MVEMHKTFLFASGFRGRGASLDFGIKYAQGLAPLEQTEIEEVLRRICERESFERRGAGWRVCLRQQRSGAELHMRASPGRDHRDRPTWIAFGLCTGTCSEGGGWRPVAIADECERLPVPPASAEGDPAYASFWQAARDGGRPWSCAADGGARSAGARRGLRLAVAAAVVLALAGLVLALVLPRASADRSGPPSAGPAPGASPRKPDTAALAELLLAERDELRRGLAFLRARGLWRFEDGSQAGGDRLEMGALLAALAALVESTCGRAELEKRLASLRCETWPRDRAGAALAPRLILLGAATLMDEELPRIAAWCRLLRALEGCGLARSAPPR